MTGLSNPRFPVLQESPGIKNFRHKKNGQITPAVFLGM